MSVGIIVFSASAIFLLLFVVDMTNSFYIKQLVTSTNNATALKTRRVIILIAGILFLSLDKVCQYILDIQDLAYQLKVAKDVMHK